MTLSFQVPGNDFVRGVILGFPGGSFGDRHGSDFDEVYSQTLGAGPFGGALHGFQ